MEKIVFSVALFFACLSLGFAEAEPTEGGSERFMVALFETCDPQHKLKCAGVLVAPDTVVTAAHCVHGSTCLKAQIESAEFGDDAEKQKDIKQVIVHPFYVFGPPDYDIAVIKLQSAFEDLTPNLKLPKVEPNPYSMVKVGGWDLTGKESYNFTLYDGMAIDKKMCQSMNKPIIITSRLICFNHPFLSTVGGFPVFMETDKFLVGIATRKIQTQGPPFLFANIYSSEIRSFLNMYIPS